MYCEASPFKPASLVNFGQVVSLPLLLGLAVAIFGVATLLHFLLVSVARRRRQVGTLKALGFLRRQVAAADLPDPDHDHGAPAAGFWLAWRRSGQPGTGASAGWESVVWFLSEC